MQMPVVKSLSFPSAGAFAIAACFFAASLSPEASGQQTAADPQAIAEGPESQAAVPERVARISYTQGGVTLQGVGETVWAQAPVNRPLTLGDYLRTDSNGRAEVQVDAAVIRLGAGSNFTFLTLEEGALRMRLTSGVLNVRVRDLQENDVIEVETPQATASILRPGNYRVEVSPTGNATIVKVSSGMLEARGGENQSFVVRNQQAATITGKDRLAFNSYTLGAPDAFDEWALDRDLRIDNALSTESSKYVSSDVVGYEDLDEYGTWRDEPGYGYVWSPTRVVAGWSPYRYGHYSYVYGWGWTWIDDAPWGFAPFHYGSWVTIGSRWCWVPGPRHGWRGGGRVGDDHRWHVPRPPRGSTVRSARGGLWPEGTRPSLSRPVESRDGFRSSDSFIDRDTRWRGGGDRTGNNRFRTRPETPRNEIPRSGSPEVAVPPSSLPPTNDRWMRIPRNERPGNEMPRNTFPRQDNYPRREMSRPEISRPEIRDRPSIGRAPVMAPSQPRAEPPRQMSRPMPSPSQQSGGRAESPRGGFSRGGVSEHPSHNGRTR
jgi:hypothetical protein